MRVNVHDRTARSNNNIPEGVSKERSFPAVISTDNITGQESTSAGQATEVSNIFLSTILFC